MHIGTVVGAGMPCIQCGTGGILELPDVASSLSGQRKKTLPTLF